MFTSLGPVNGKTSVYRTILYAFFGPVNSQNAFCRTKSQWLCLCTVELKLARETVSI